MLYLARGNVHARFTWAGINFALCKAPTLEAVPGYVVWNPYTKIGDLTLNWCRNLQLSGTIFDGSDSEAIIVPNSVQEFCVNTGITKVFGYTICSRPVSYGPYGYTAYYCTVFVLPDRLYDGELCTNSVLPPYTSGYTTGVYAAAVVRAVGARNWNEDSKAYSFRILISPQGTAQAFYWAHDANVAAGAVSYYNCVVDWRSYTASLGPAYGLYPTGLVSNWAYSTLGDLNRKAIADPIRCLTVKNGGNYTYFANCTTGKIDTILTKAYIQSLLEVGVRDHGVKFLGFDPWDKDVMGWRDLAYDAYASVQFYNGNGIALFRDLREMQEGVRSTLKTIKGLGGNTLAAIAQLYLTFHYGYKLLMMDTEELTKELIHYDSLTSKDCKCQKGRSTASTGSGGHWSVRLNYEVYYDLYGQLTSELQKLVDLFDIDPLDPTIWWDLTPYSFVVDWFVDIGDLLERIQVDTEIRNKHKVRAVGRTVKAECRTVKLNRSLVTAKFYERQYDKQLITPPVNVPVNTTLAPQHWVEGAALAVSRF